MRAAACVFRPRGATVNSTARQSTRDRSIHPAHGQRHISHHHGGLLGRLDVTPASAAPRRSTRRFIVTDRLPTNPYATASSDPDVLHWRDRLLDRFPPVTFAFAYGSGISSQLGSRKKDNMIDLVFAVDDSAAWHQDNLRRNPGDYSFLKYLGADNVADIQDDFGARLYYNTLVPFEDRVVKYGVIHVNSLHADLAHWTTLYLSGRLHKPVTVLASNPITLAQCAANLRSAVHVALYRLPRDFSREDLYMAIASISYLGDFRMTFGENPHKIKNIVHGNFDGFEQLYQPILKAMPHVHVGKSVIEQEQGPDTTARTLRELPSELLARMCLAAGLNVQRAAGAYAMPDDGTIRALAERTDHDRLVHKAVAGIVKGSSRSQSIKGLLTAGPVKSWDYVAAKLRKYAKAISQ